jgi:nucleotide-binding universal stress UspA family protein
VFTKVIAAIDSRDAGDDAAVLAGLLAGDGDVVLTPLDVVGARRPRAALTRMADDERADVIVMGSPHHSGLARLVLGDPGRDLLHHAPCPVAIASRGYRLADRHALRTVGVGHDGSDAADAALATAAKLARERGARLEVLGVARAAEGQARTRRVRLERSILRSVRRIAPEAHVDVVVSDPRLELDRFSGQVDLLVIGARRPGAHLRSPLGGVADHLEEHARGPVLVVPAGAAADRRGRVTVGAPAAG